MAERVRWQLLAWQQTGNLERGQAPHGGIAALTLVPEHLEPDPGRQEALFGPRSPSAAMERAAGRLQAMLGHQAVTRAEIVGGRGPAEQVIRVPFGDLPPATPHGGPWPGRLPAPYPAALFPLPVPARVLDTAGQGVAVSGRSVLSAPPARLGVEGRAAHAVTGWAGPWTAVEQWWEPDRARRIARLQVTTADGRGWLLLLERGRWWAEACYG